MTTAQLDMAKVDTRFLKRVLAGFGILVLSLSAVGCSAVDQTEVAEPAQPTTVAVSDQSQSNRQRGDDGLSTAVFAGGCFWCMERPFDELPGVVSTTSGYTGGTVEDPTYAEVSRGDTGHYEALEVQYDPEQVSYDQLLETFWYNVDPVDDRGQFCDKGDQYRSAVFYGSPEQRAAAEDSKDAIANRLNETIATEILPAAQFYDAEDYHQNYYQTHAVRYKFYRNACGRDRRLAEVWGDDAPEHE